MNNETPEIAELTRRIAKDPKSKLFVLLAEEHKKTGDLEMAIHVLLEGLKNNPDYVTARAFLAKLLLVKGDFPGAQKEFEEVVTTTPDNFMAQRSLGDLLVLQNKPHDALTHYKAALSLNPRDEKLTSLILDVEAGRDVRPKIQRGIPVVAQAAAPPFTETPRAPASFMTESEEPEEVLIVEPLDSEAFALEPIKSDAAVPGEQEREPVSSVTAGEPFDFDFSVQSHEKETVLKEDILPDQDLFREMDGGGHPSIFEETGKAPEKISEDVSEKSDDFTTDTLAELYIAQGFYEKAIEIYERMLSDKPNSRGLQDKLAGVRACAAQTSAPAAEKKEADMPAEREAREYWPQQNLAPEPFAEAREYVPPVTSEEISIEAEVLSEPGEFKPGEPSPEENVFAEFGEYAPRTEPEEQLPAVGEAGFEALVQAPDLESARTRPQDTDFEPREYLPPKSAKEPLKPASAKGMAAQPPTPAARKEKIARLETWLTNIKKEK